MDAILYDNGLVCEPLANPHYHHHVAHVHLFSYVKPTIRHHCHHVRICHAHEHVHHCWELGGPAGFVDVGGYGDVGEASAGSGGFGASDMGGDIGSGLGSAVLGPELFGASRVAGVASGSPFVGTIGQPMQPTPPMGAAVPEVPVPAMLLMGFAAMFAASLFRKKGTRR
jgi:hypothetical protein